MQSYYICGMAKQIDHLERLRTKIARGMKRNKLITLADVEGFTGVDRVNVHRILKGRDPRYSTAAKLLDAFDAD